MSADVRLSWRPIDRLEVAIAGKNLLEGGQQEYVSELRDIVPTEVQRSVVASLRWEF
jgi:hypothetical protein